MSLVTASLSQAQGACTYYAHPDWARTGWALLAATARHTLTEAEPGSGFQLAWSRVYISTARSESELALLRDWLAGDPPDGLGIEAELRWRIVPALAPGGRRRAGGSPGRAGRGEGIRGAGGAGTRGGGAGGAAARLAPARGGRARRRSGGGGRPAGVVGELRQPGDEAAGQVTAAEGGRHGQRGQLRRPVRDAPAGRGTGDDFEYALVRRDREQDRAVRVGELSVQLLGVAAERVVQVTHVHAEGQSGGPVREAQRLVQAQDLGRGERPVQYVRTSAQARRVTSGHLRLPSRRGPPSSRRAPGPAADPPAAPHGGRRRSPPDPSRPRR